MWFVRTCWCILGEVKRDSGFAERSFLARECFRSRRNLANTDQDYTTSKIAKIDGDSSRNARNGRVTLWNLSVKVRKACFRLCKENYRSMLRLLRISFVHHSPNKICRFLRRNVTCSEPQRDLYLFALVCIGMSMRIFTSSRARPPVRESRIIRKLESNRKLRATHAPFFPRFSKTFKNHTQRNWHTRNIISLINLAQSFKMKRIYIQLSESYFWTSKNIRGKITVKIIIV